MGVINNAGQRIPFALGPGVHIPFSQRWEKHIQAVSRLAIFTGYHRDVIEAVLLAFHDLGGQASFDSMDVYSAIAKKVSTPRYGIKKIMLAASYTPDLIFSAARMRRAESKAKNYGGTFFSFVSPRLTGKRQAAREGFRNLERSKDSRNYYMLRSLHAQEGDRLEFEINGDGNGKVSLRTKDGSIRDSVAVYTEKTTIRESKPWYEPSFYHPEGWRTVGCDMAHGEPRTFDPSKVAGGVTTHEQREGTNKTKDGNGKPPIHLIPKEALYQEAQVRRFAAERKYGPWSMEDGAPISEWVNPAVRHCLEFMDGVDADHESKLSHLAHARAVLGIAIDQMHRAQQGDKKMQAFDDRRSKLTAEQKRTRWPTRI